MTLGEATALLAAAGCETPRLDAEVLLAHALGVSRVDLYRREFETPPDYELLIERRARREPVAYIVGFRHFRDLALQVDPRVLIPRPETEHLVEAALSLPLDASVIDVGTGSGAVALALKDERPDLRVIGTDISEDALEVARKNAARLRLAVDFVHGDLLAGQRADAVVSNPPYVEPSDDLPPELGFEPPGALFGDVYARLVADAVAVADLVAIEIGPPEVARLFPTPPQVVPDLAGVPRVIVWRR